MVYFVILLLSLLLLLFCILVFVMAHKCSNLKKALSCLIKKICVLNEFFSGLNFRTVSYEFSVRTTIDFAQMNM